MLYHAGAVSERGVGRVYGERKESYYTINTSNQV